MREKFSNRGFTLIELLVVISIISMISSVVLASLGEARESAQIARARSDLVQFRNAIALMTLDTGVWPNGCPTGRVFLEFEGSNNEVSLNSQEAGLVTAPVEEAYDPECYWDASSVGKWRGPYYPVVQTDPWGHEYWFDNDYHPYRDCDTATALPLIAALVSGGPNGISGAEMQDYDCDDIYVQLSL